MKVTRLKWYLTIEELLKNYVTICYKDFLF